MTTTQTTGVVGFPVQVVVGDNTPPGTTKGDVLAGIITGVHEDSNVTVTVFVNTSNSWVTLTSVPPSDAEWDTDVMDSKTTITCWKNIRES